LAPKSPLAPKSRPVPYHSEEVEVKKQYDHINIPVNADDPNLIELWNIVFMQYNRVSETELKELEQKHVDTGLGLERLTAILQNVESNYDIDIFEPIFSELNFLASPTRPYSGKFNNEDIGGIDTAYRIIADHVRMIVVSIADGLSPSNKKVGNLLRQIIRRSLRYGLINLKILSYNRRKGANKYNYKPFLHRLVSIVCKTLSDGNPKLRNEGTVHRIIDLVKSEEERYLNTLSKGLNKFQNLYEKYQKRPEYRGVRIFKGEDIYNLYKTYGFPLEFSISEANERGYKVDVKGYDKVREQAISRETVLNIRKPVSRQVRSKK
jgi:alanyl-tRNA synthetase